MLPLYKNDLKYCVLVNDSHIITAAHMICLCYGIAPSLKGRITTIQQFLGNFNQRAKRVPVFPSISQVASFQKY